MTKRLQNNILPSFPFVLNYIKCHCADYKLTHPYIIRKVKFHGHQYPLGQTHTDATKYNLNVTCTNAIPVARRNQHCLTTANVSISLGKSAIVNYRSH